MPACVVCVYARRDDVHTHMHTHTHRTHANREGTRAATDVVVVVATVATVAVVVPRARFNLPSGILVFSHVCARLPARLHGMRACVRAC